MYCDYELHKLLMDLKGLSHSINSSSNGVVTNFYNAKYENALYTSYLDNYESDSNMLSALKDKYVVLRLAVSVKMASSNFTVDEQKLLKTSLDVIQTAITSAEAALDYYDVAIKAYKSKW